MNKENKKIDYGWRYKLDKVLLLDDRSEKLDDLKYLNQLTISELSNKFFFAERCLQCGICNTTCPYSNFESPPFLPRDFIQKARLGLLDLASDDLWFCTNCGSCEIKCPFDIKIIDIINDLREIVYNYGAGYIPESIRNVAVSIVNYKNPWKENQELRYKNIKEKNFSIMYNQDSRINLLFGCCMNHYDRHGQKILNNSIFLMQKAGIECEYLFDSEYCCGDTLLRCGNIDGFDIIRQENINAIKTTTIKKIIAISPHCYHILKTKYFKNDNEFIIHPLIYELHEIITNGLIKIKKMENRRVTFHDPCFLCKHNNYAIVLRDIITSLCDNFIEMEHHGANSICCGGGGCGVWVDSKKGQRLTEKRLQEALKVDAEILLTACPICISMLESNLIGEFEYSNLQIKDITEIFVEAVI
jgi:Fe-S oxidoreductase